MSNIVDTPFLNLSATKDAFLYQAEAFNAVKDLDYSAIFHEQGLGKTKIAIDLTLYWLSNKTIDTVMIVTKKQLVKNWQDEFAFHTHLKPVVLGNNRGKNYYVFNGVSKVIIANFETIEIERDRVDLFLECRNVAIIIDESTKLKNPDSQLTQCFFALSQKFKKRVIMTGTPIANRPYDIWSQIYFLDNGKSLGTEFADFKKKNDLSNDLSSSESARISFEENVGSIFSKIRQFSVRETKASCGIELPEKTYVSIFANFTEQQIKIYNDVIHDCEVEINKDGEMILDDDSECLKRLLRLNQIASNPRLLDENYTELSGKEIELDNLINQVIARGEKCIIWSCYIENIEYFATKYQKYGAVKIHGSMDIEDRNSSVDKFKNDNTCKLLFATPQAAKEGLTLTVANNAIFYDRTFNLDDYLQAQDRIHRISQKKKCTIYNILIRDSIDDWIDALLKAKQNAASLAQGDISKSNYLQIADYTYADIIKEILKEATGYGGNN